MVVAETGGCGWSPKDLQRLAHLSPSDVLQSQLKTLEKCIGRIS